MKTNYTVLRFAIALVFAGMLSGQDRFKTTRLTFDPAQDGFASWSADGKYIIHSSFSWKDSIGRNGIWKITLEGKESQQIFAGIAEHPALSPDGRSIVFDADTGGSMRILDLKEGIAKKFLPDSIVIRSGGLPCWSPNGTHIVFKDGGIPSLCVYEIATGKVFDIFHEEGMVPLPCFWSKDDDKIYFALMDRQTRKSTLWKISPDGKAREQITGHREGVYRYMALSPEGSLLVYGSLEEKFLGLWVMKADGGRSLPLAITRPGHNESPAFSPNGKHLTFTSTRSGNFDIWMMDMDIEKLNRELEALNR